MAEDRVSSANGDDDAGCGVTRLVGGSLVLSLNSEIWLYTVQGLKELNQ